MCNEGMNDIGAVYINTALHIRSVDQSHDESHAQSHGHSQC